MALSPPASGVPIPILVPSVLGLPRGAAAADGMGSGDAATRALEGAIGVAWAENQQLRAAIARVNETTPLFPYKYEMESKVCVHGCDADATEVVVPAGPVAKPVQVRDCHGRQEKTVLRIGGNPGVLMIEMSSNLRVISNCTEDLVLSGCEAVELVLGVNPPRVTLLACKNCIVVVPKYNWHNAVHSVGCYDVSVPIDVSVLAIDASALEGVVKSAIDVGSGDASERILLQNRVAVLAIDVSSGDAAASASERILLPDLLRTSVRLARQPGNVAVPIS
ncbi:hypothetical protein T484DRAFT_1874982 [Baffinella frigidus]|nr:hypothetical protein T484DRAFT_1874982 [Cryptophyta sp. CCMP2293]